MPDREVQTLRDLVYYQYAKLIARSAFEQPDGMAAKGSHYGFIKNTFRALRDGRKQWSDITREDWQLVEGAKVCAYCGAAEELAREHIVPRTLRVNDRCESCDTIQSIHNQVWSCRTCNSRKARQGLYNFYRSLYPLAPKFYDHIPPLVEKKYLKTIYECLTCAGCLDSADMDGDGAISVLDIDFALAQFLVY